MPALYACGLPHEPHDTRGGPMKRPRLYRAILGPALCLCLFLSGCSSRLIELGSNETLPDSIRQYKHVVLHAGTAYMMNTGVRVARGDMITLMAEGRLNYCAQGGCRWDNVRPEDGWPLMVRIGKKNTIQKPLPRGKNGFTYTAYGSGEIYLGYKQGVVDAFGKPDNPRYYRNDAGRFLIDIIVWRTDDFIEVAGFLEKMQKRKPDSKPLADAFEHADIFRQIAVARAETTKEVEKTRSEIRQMKGDAGDDQVKALEDRLSQLQAELAKLDEMQRKLAEEKAKSQELAEKLEEKEAREQDLLSRIADSSRTPPVLLVASPKNGLKTEAAVVVLSGAAEDDIGLASVRVFVNDRPLAPAAGRGLTVTGTVSPPRVDFSRRLRLQDGPNRILIRAEDVDGLSTEKKLTVTRIRQRSNIWAVVIGINDYPNIARLKYAVNDARAFHRYLVDDNGVPRENVTLLVNREATLQRVRSVLGTHLKNRAAGKDTVVIYFAGHGAVERDTMSPDGDGLEKYLLPYGADLNDLYATAMPMREVAHIFNRIKAERLIFIADSCYSGASGGRTVSMGGIRANLSEAFMDRLTRGKGRVVITASGANEVSAEDDRYRHGVFTYFLLEGLRGRADLDQDGLITVDEAYRYVSGHVTRVTGQEQHPVKKGTVEGRLVLGIVR
jgi:hypothetical protein